MTITKLNVWGGKSVAAIPSHVCRGCAICEREQRLAALWAENARIEALDA